MTSPNRQPRRLWRSTGAVLLGLLAVIVPSIATDMVLRATGVFPPLGQPMADVLFVLATAYRSVYAVAGSYIAARLAPPGPGGRPMQHALVIGVVGLALSIAGAAAAWKSGPELGPRWYPLALIAIAMPCAWVGGRLRGMQMRAGDHV